MKCGLCDSDWHDEDECPKQNGDVVIELSENFEGFGTAQPSSTNTSSQIDKEKKPYFAS